MAKPRLQVRRWLPRSWWWPCAIASALLLATVTAGGGFGRTRTTVSFAVPRGWPPPRYRFEQNPITPAGFELGRRLFYDARLSRDGSVSCATCHQQFAAFAQVGHRVSHGVGGINGRRNTPGLFNLAWAPELMWDGAVHELEVQPLAPLGNPVEMDSSVALVLPRLQTDPRYPGEFEAAFGTPGIDSRRLLRALAQFTGSLVSANARYDQVMRGEARFSPQEQVGLTLFRADCASCHREPLFTDYSFRNNGLDAVPADPGRAAISLDDADRGRFRVPSLRNVALTAPYMHDGRFRTLRAVVDRYAGGIRPTTAVDPLLAHGEKLSDADRRALVAFLGTLTDDTFTHDPRFRQPRE